MKWSAVAIEVTGRCNARCSYCPRGTGHAAPAGDIAIDTFNRSLQLAKQGRSKAILLHGSGEPFLHPQLALLVRKTREAGYLAFLSTNLLACTQRNIREVLAAGINQIEVHFDAAAQQMSVQNIYEIIYYICRCNQRLRSNACRIEVNYAVSTHKERLLAEKALRLLPSSVTSRIYTPYDWHAFLATSSTTNYLWTDCWWYAHRGYVVHSNGDVVICCLDHYKFSKVHNVHEIDVVSDSSCANRSMCAQCPAMNWGRDWIQNDILSVSTDQRHRLLHDRLTSEGVL